VAKIHFFNINVCVYEVKKYWHKQLICTIFTLSIRNVTICLVSEKLGTNEYEYFAVW